MMMRLCKFLSQILVCVLVLLTPHVVCAASSNIPMGDVSDVGAWNTGENLKIFTQNASNDIANFVPTSQNPQLVKDYVPIEAKLGMAFMNALSRIADVLDNTLVRFVIVFIIVAYLVWTMFETYQMIIAGKGEAMKLAETLAKKGFMVAVWVAVLYAGPARVFLWAMGPIVAIGTYLSDLILSAVANVAGVEIPDTCAAIHAYVADNISQTMIIDAPGAANIMCVPTRLSGYFYTAMMAGWNWIKIGFGTSAFTVLMGVVFVGLFAYNMWKFALIAFGVIANLFLSVMMLPFTAVAETTAKTSYKGIAGDIFNGFLGLFKTKSLSEQVKGFIGAAIYFTALSVVVAICSALLAGIMGSDFAARVPSLDDANFMKTLLTGVLVGYLATHASEIAKNVGGGIEDGFGQKMVKDATSLGKDAYKQAKGWWKIIREESKK